MRAAFGFLVIVLVMAAVLMLAKQQAKVAVPVQATGEAASVPVQALPQAVGKQVEGLLQQGAERASEANP